MFRVMGLKILGRVGTLFFKLFFFLEKNIIFCILKGKTHNFFSENLKKNSIHLLVKVGSQVYFYLA